MAAMSRGPASQHPLPGDVVAGAAQGGECVAHLARRARLPGQQGHLAVGGDPSARDPRDDPVVGPPPVGGVAPTSHPARGCPVSLANHPPVITLSE